MNVSKITDLLYGDKAKFRYLLLAATFLLFTFLGGREIWTQEFRWAEIVRGMFYRHDFFHPYLGEQMYYDKPLLSYWLIAMLAKVTGQLSEWELRVPSALSGLLAIWAIYRLGSVIKNKQLGLLAGWLLLTTFYFVFWARVSSADILNLAGSLFAVSWYMEKRHQAGFFDYTIFFLILALTALCKGLIGIIVPLIAVFTDLLLQKTWRAHVRWPLFFCMVPACIVYLAPFYFSLLLGDHNGDQNGLYLVYRENILRYLQPFDHRDPIYLYFLYLPIYTLPWAFILFPALYQLKSRWKKMSMNAKWTVYTLAVLFIFLTLSGSRRSYYILPVVPFAILFIAEHLLANEARRHKRRQSLGFYVFFAFAVIFLLIDVWPSWYYAKFGVSAFATTLKIEANKIKPWNQWEVIMLDGENKLNFYLNLPPNTKNYHLKENEKSLTTDNVLHKWPILKRKPDHSFIFISDERYQSILKPYMRGYRIMKAPALPYLLSLMNHKMTRPIAFIPS